LKHYIVNIKRNNASLIGIIHNSVNPHKIKCFMSIALFGRKMLRRALFGRFFLFVGGVGGRERERERERESYGNQTRWNDSIHWSWILTLLYFSIYFLELIFCMKTYLDGMLKEWKSMGWSDEWNGWIDDRTVIEPIWTGYIEDGPTSIQNYRMIQNTTQMKDKLFIHKFSPKLL